MTHLIYKHTFTNGKSYIGYTKNSLEARLKGHITAALHAPKTIFEKAIQKYGADNITSECLEDNIESVEIAKAREIFFIEKYNTFGRNSNGYNMTKGGDGTTLFGSDNGMYGKTHTKEAKDKISKLAKERTGEKSSWNKSNKTEEQLKNRAQRVAESRRKNGTYAKEYNGMYGKTHTKEARDKISNAAKERTGEKNSFYGKTHTKESRDKISNARKGKKFKKENCEFCNREFGVNNIKRHIAACRNNPDAKTTSYNKNLHK